MAPPRTAPQLVADRGPLARAVWFAVASAVLIGICGAAAVTTQQLLLFPSLGPTVLLLVLRPMDGESSLVNTVLGHLAALLAGMLGLAAAGLIGAPDVVAAGTGAARVGAVVLALALTAAVQAVPLLRHPPAAATTLLVSLGLLDSPPQLAAVVIGVVLLAAAGWALNRLAGLPVRWYQPS